MRQMPRPVCVGCRREMTMVKAVTVQFNAQSVGPYQQWQAYLAECPLCGAQCLTRYGQSPSWEHFRVDAPAEAYVIVEERTGRDDTHARFHVRTRATDPIVLIVDVGHGAYRSVTNDAEWVVAQLAPTLNGRKLFYIDSTGDAVDELLVEDGKFAGFLCMVHRT